MSKQTIAEVKDLLTRTKVEGGLLEELRKDARKGIQQLVHTYDKKQAREHALLEAEKEKRAFDHRYIQPGMLLAGVDEAGRGPLAGPVTAAAVILPEDFSLPGLTDSKQLNEVQRNQFYHYIKKTAVAYYIAIVDSGDIDRVNIYEATKLAMKEAIEALQPSPQVVLVDAVKLSLKDVHTEPIIKGDDQSLAIAAASILAKVKRDEIMQQLDMTFPAYEFSKNKGYGTATHLEALERYGPCSSHRRSFAPISSM